MENNPIVTVIIPTYNRVAKVGKAIESALKQTYAHKQIVVIDDGSTDNTAELMKKYPGVEYVIQDHGGQAAARNNGLSRANGKYIASLDSDDTYPCETNGIWQADVARPVAGDGAGVRRVQRAGASEYLRFRSGFQNPRDRRLGGG